MAVHLRKYSAQLGSAFTPYPSSPLNPAQQPLAGVRRAGEQGCAGACSIEDKTSRFSELILAEVVSKTQFACYTCYTLKDPKDFSVSQPSQVRQMDLPDGPTYVPRRMCIGCGIAARLYKPGDVLHCNDEHQSRIWVCKCFTVCNDQDVSCVNCHMMQPLIGSTSRAGIIDIYLPYTFEHPQI